MMEKEIKENGYKLAFLMFNAVQSYYLIFPAFWWTINIFRDLYKFRGQPFKSRMFYLGPYWQLPMESFFKMYVAFSMVTPFLWNAYITGNQDDRNFENVYLCVGFGVIGLFELLVHWQFLLPDGIEVAVFVLVYFMRAVLTYNQVHGLSIIEEKAHDLTVVNSIGAIAGALLQFLHPERAICAMIRPFFLLLDGTWILFYSCIAYFTTLKSTWYLDGPHAGLVLMSIYTWLCLLVFFGMILVGAIIRVEQWTKRSKCPYQKLGMEEAQDS